MPKLEYDNNTIFSYAVQKVKLRKWADEKLNRSDGYDEDKNMARVILDLFEKAERWDMLQAEADPTKIEILQEVKSNGDI
jgi:hypothetical protein